MGMSEREYHIKVLENLLSHYKAREQCEGYYDSTLKDNVEALEYAISSLKTDEAYNLMYEGADCVEVVRCENCVHWQLLKDSPIHYCMPTHRFTGTKEFCSSGKERTKKPMR